MLYLQQHPALRIREGQLYQNETRLWYSDGASASYALQGEEVGFSVARYANRVTKI